jgi:hypothetical protein
MGGRVRIREHDAESETVLVDATLGFCLNLASLQISEPSSVQRLLGRSPRETTEALRSMEPSFKVYEQQLASLVQVRPLVVFLERGSDPAMAARRFELSLTSWPAKAPPALLAGPSADVLIVFEPIAVGEAPARSGGPVAVARIAAADGFALAQNSSAEMNPHFYLVEPREWKQGATFVHTRCREPRPGLEIVTKLVYKGGITDTRTTPIKDANWGECKLPGGADLRSVTVTQASRKTAGQPAIIAASYFRSPQPGPLLADWILVNR